MMKDRKGTKYSLLVSNRNLLEPLRGRVAVGSIYILDLDVENLAGFQTALAICFLCLLWTVYLYLTEF